MVNAACSNTRSLPHFDRVHLPHLVLGGERLLYLRDLRILQLGLAVRHDVTSVLGQRGPDPGDTQTGSRGTRTGKLEVC